MAEERDDEGFLGRWSRLKQAAREQPAGEAPDDAPPPAERTPDPMPVPEVEAPALPPLESLDAGSDYTAFLRREVPADLRRLALRKAWTSDPAIAAFRGFAEYDWNCNAPGYGALRPTDDVKGLLAAFFPEPEADPEKDAASGDQFPLPPREREGARDSGKGEGRSGVGLNPCPDSPSPSPPLRGGSHGRSQASQPHSAYDRVAVVRPAAVGSMPSPGAGEGEIA